MSRAAPQSINVTERSISPALGGMEMMKATFSSFEFPAHFHETYVIELVLEGQDEFVCNRRSFAADPGEIVIIHPGEVHTGSPRRGTVLQYLSFYPSVELLRKIGQSGSDVTFGRAIVRSPQAYRLLDRAYRLLANNLDGGQACFEAAIKLLADGGVCDEAILAPEQRVRLAVDMLRSGEPISLGELSAAVGLSPFHLIRLFKRQIGVTPHQYAINLRLEKSMACLRTGESAAQVALACGFHDQSHFTRYFLRHTGTTPVRYASAFRG